MKRLFLLPALATAVLLLSACPDTKLPSPTPKVPEPKAAASMSNRHASPVALNFSATEVL